MKTFSQFFSEATDPKGPIKKYMSPEEIASKHKISLESVNSQLNMGIKIESEHTGSEKMAKMIALQHLEEFPDYYTRLKKAEKIKEEKKPGLWANIHAKRKRGEPPAKPGEKGYPKTLNIKEGIKQARKNVGASTCWKNKKLGNPPTKIKNGREVPNCVSENYTRIQSRGTTYSIMLNWRGKCLELQMFFPQFTRPTKEQVTSEVNKIYPNAKVLSFNPALKDPTKPLLFTGDENGPK